jgi:hypothetical protein
MNYLANDLPLPQPYDELYRASQWNSDELKALAKPATKLQIAHCLALLLKSFPNAGAADAEVYGGMLVQDVAAAQPAIGDIEETCRHIRRTSRFLPTIAEVLETLADAKERRKSIAFSTGLFLESNRRRSVESAQHVPKYLEHHQAVPQPIVLADDPQALPL